MQSLHTTRSSYCCCWEGPCNEGGSLWACYPYMGTGDLIRNLWVNRISALLTHKSLQIRFKTCLTVTGPRGFCKLWSLLWQFLALMIPNTISELNLSIENNLCLNLEKCILTLPAILINVGYNTFLFTLYLLQICHSLINFCNLSLWANFLPPLEHFLQGFCKICQKTISPFLLLVYVKIKLPQKHYIIVVNHIFISVIQIEIWKPQVCTSRKC